ncbi:hypothetical protein TP2_18100 [Thioclava pacifica DSM 10166]|uniref:Cardiolipin synthase N-terminal domain-containing protein n=1 Tax=Thioclava pacifica DSM 10166 TaxID=1353537 RepID=A0A074J707_9RHOB|nr:hypothetical protein TP2_18100 [Thioclava pacifica DSM 10166]
MEILQILAVSAAVLLGLWFLFWFCIQVPAGMAKVRGRNAVGWVLFGLITNPIVAMLLLWLLGKKQLERA